MPEIAPVVLRPVRAAVLLWAGLVAYLGCFAPFIDGFGVQPFLNIALPYSLFLSLSAIGVLLAARSRILWFWIISGTVPLLGGIVFWLWIRLAPSDLLFYTIPFAAMVTLILNGLWLGLGCVVALLGWLSYVRWRHLMR